MFEQFGKHKEVILFCIILGVVMATTMKIINLIFGLIGYVVEKLIN